MSLDRGRLAWGVVFCVVLALLPFAVGSQYVLNVAILAMIFAALATSWNTICGFTGIFTFGHQAYFGLGAYASSLLAIHLGVSPWLSVWAGAAIAGAANVVIAAPILKLRGAAYVAIVTLIFAEVINLIALNLNGLTGGPSGLVGIPPLPSIGQIEFTLGQLKPYYYAALVLLALTLAVCGWALHGRSGLALRAIRDSDDAAESLGLRVAAYKVGVTTFGACLAGLIGGFYAHYIQLITPESTLGITVMVQILAITIIGGVAYFFGPLFGAFLVLFGLEYLRALGSYQLLVYGGVLMLVIVFLPDGLATVVRPWVRGTPRPPLDLRRMGRLVGSRAAEGPSADAGEPEAKRQENSEV